MFCYIYSNVTEEVDFTPIFETLKTETKRLSIIFAGKVFDNLFTISLLFMILAVYDYNVH